MKIPSFKKKKWNMVSQNIHRLVGKTGCVGELVVLETIKECLGNLA